MKKIKILLLLTLVLLVGCSKNVWTETEDSLKFKKEFENLNNTKNSSGNEYLNINIASANPIKYLTIEETLEFLDSGSGILYFGRPGCPYCRSTINALFDFAKENDVETIYYYNPEEIRKEQTTEYKIILEKLDEFLKVDTSNQNEEDEDFDPTLKRLSVPDVYFISKGQVIGRHNENRSDFKGDLRKEQTSELKKIYSDLYSDYIDAQSVCDEEC